MSNALHTKANLKCDDILRGHVALAAADDVGDLLREDVEQLNDNSVVP